MTRSSDIEQAQSTQTEQHLLAHLTKEQLRLVAAWLAEEVILRQQAGYSEETCETIKYIGHRLEILGKDA